MATTTNISCTGDDKFKRVLATLSAQRGETVAVLVREALDKTYGGDMAEIERFLFANSGADKHQKNVKQPA